MNVTPFGSGVPVIPTAKSATLARIASPVTQTRSLQAVLHNAVKDYFSGSRRLVKRGDLIAVVFGTGAAAVYSGLEELEKEKEGAVPDYLSTLYVIPWFSVNVSLITTSIGSPSWVRHD